MKKKQRKINKSTKSSSKKLKVSSKTLTSKSNTISTTAKMKTDSKQSATRKKIDASLSSSVNTKKKEQGGLSLHDVLKNLKKQSILNREKGGHGFIRPTEEEKTVLKNSKVKNAMGRPKKLEQDRKNVVSIRFSLAEQQLLMFSAEKYGFSNWKDYLRELALSHARDTKNHA